jgi:hypothetical protein
MEKLVAKLRKDYPTLTFQEGVVASWSPQTSTVFYAVTGQTSDLWSLLHELGHAILGHQSYDSDASLLQKETEAWEKAIVLGKAYALRIDAEHVQVCLDTYRDWLHKRSTCPMCNSHGLQQNKALYSCLNCQTQWKVTSARFCRPYRLKKALAI